MEDTLLALVMHSIAGMVRRDGSEPLRPSQTGWHGVLKKEEKERRVREREREIESREAFQTEGGSCTLQCLQGAKWAHRAKRPWKKGAKGQEQAAVGTLEKD